jgi:hypothetical protein
MKSNQLSLLSILSKNEIKTLKKFDIKCTTDFLDATTDIGNRKKLSNQIGIPIYRIKQIASVCDLLRINSISVDIAESLFYICGIKNIQELLAIAGVYENREDVFLVDIAKKYLNPLLTKLSQQKFPDPRNKNSISKDYYKEPTERLYKTLFEKGYLGTDRGISKALLKNIIKESIDLRPILVFENDYLEEFNLEFSKFQRTKTKEFLSEAIIPIAGMFAVCLISFIVGARNFDTNALDFISFMRTQSLESVDLVSHPQTLVQMFKYQYYLLFVVGLFIWFVMNYLIILFVNFLGILFQKILFRKSTEALKFYIDLTEFSEKGNKNIVIIFFILFAVFMHRSLNNAEQIYNMIISSPFLSIIVVVVAFIVSIRMIVYLYTKFPVNSKKQQQELRKIIYVNNFKITLLLLLIVSIPNSLNYGYNLISRIENEIIIGRFQSEYQQYCDKLVTESNNSLQNNWAYEWGVEDCNNFSLNQILSNESQKFSTMVNFDIDIFLDKLIPGGGLAIILLSFIPFVITIGPIQALIYILLLLLSDIVVDFIKLGKLEINLEVFDITLFQLLIIFIVTILSDWGFDFLNTRNTYCPNCLELNSDENNYCSGCGFQIYSQINPKKTLINSDSKQ